MVEWKKLGEVCKVSNGERPVSEILENGRYPYINAGRTNSGFLNEYNSKGGAVTTPSHGEGGIGSVLYQNSEFWCGALCYRMYTYSGINNRFLFHYLSDNSEAIISCKNTGGQPYINRKQLENIKIPIPSLSEQERIVGILDTFTSAIDNLKEQIIQRRKQYEYYRDQLLDLEGKLGVEMKTLEEMGVFFGGLTGKSKDDFVEGNAKFVTYMNVFANPALDILMTGVVRIAEGEKQNKIQKGDILFTGSSETPEEAGMSCVVTKELEGDYYLNSFCFGFRLNQPDQYNLNYLKHILRSYLIRKKIAKSASGVTRFNISKARFGKIKLPIPSLQEQQRIVSILDTFEASIQNLEEQLKLREKQYEYYRNKLLTFE